MKCSSNHDRTSTVFYRWWQTLSALPLSIRSMNFKLDSSLYETCCCSCVILHTSYLSELLVMRSEQKLDQLKGQMILSGPVSGLDLIFPSFLRTLLSALMTLSGVGFRPVTSSLSATFCFFNFFTDTLLSMSRYVKFSVNSTLGITLYQTVLCLAFFIGWNWNGNKIMFFVTGC